MTTGSDETTGARCRTCGRVGVAAVCVGAIVLLGLVRDDAQSREPEPSPTLRWVHPAPFVPAESCNGKRAA